MAGLFQVLYGQADGTFKKAAVLNGTDDEPLIIPIDDKNQQTQNICTRPTAVDWDGDGDLDLVVGNFAGTFYFFKGEGEGKFDPKPEPIMVGDEPLKITGVHSDPFTVDWDNDGDIDVLSGSSSGGVYWAENTAGAGKLPTLKAFETLIEPGQRAEYGKPLKEEQLTGPTSSTRVYVDDVNSDGKLDVLVGDSVALISPADGLSEEKFAERYEAWQNELQAAASALRSGEEDAEKRQEASQKYSQLYQKRSEFMTEDRTGFVWLYLQK